MLTFKRIFMAALLLCAGGAGAESYVRIPISQAAASTTPTLKFVSLTIPSFGTTEIGSSVTRDAVLQNNKATSVALTVPGAGSVSGAGFSFVSTTCGASLNSGQSCAIRVQIDNVIGTYSGTLSVAVGGATKTAALAGSRTAPAVAVALSPNPMYFGVLYSGQSNTQTMTVTNTGTTTITSWQYPMGSGLTAVSTTCGVLAPGGTCTVTVRADTPYEGVNNGSWAYVRPFVGTTMYAAEGVAGLNVVAGNAPIGGLSLTSTLDFGNLARGVWSPYMYATLQNSTGSSVTVTNVPSSPVGQFVVDTAVSTCKAGTVLTPGQNCNVAVRFNSNNPAGYVWGGILLPTSAGKLPMEMRGMLQ